MIVPHFAALLIFAFLVSIVFGVLSRETMRDGAFYSAKVFSAFVGIAILLGWLMLLLGR